MFMTIWDVKYLMTIHFSGLRVARSLVFSCRSIFFFCVVFCRLLFVLFFLLSIVLSFLLRFSNSVYPIGIFKLFFVLLMSIIRHFFNSKMVFVSWVEESFGKFYFIACIYLVVYISGIVIPRFIIDFENVAVKIYN